MLTVKSLMLNTRQCYETDPALIATVANSIQNQYIVAENETVEIPKSEKLSTKYIISGKRSFEAAKDYSSKKVAVLNFASNHNIGGKPYSSTTQEESLCHISTLLPCLEALSDPFYKKHEDDFHSGRLTNIGNDDLIYTPDVVVFKTDVGKYIEPQLLPKDEWYKVNVISCAAPRLIKTSLPTNYEFIITQRIKRILDVAAREKTEVLILGAWGCGYYKNPPEVISRVFCSLLPNYSFETVEFAMASGQVSSSSPFYKEVKALQQIRSSYAPANSDHIDLEERFKTLLKGIGRQGTDELLRQLEMRGFFTAPGSVKHHNNFKRGLLKHSFDVYDEALYLRNNLLKANPDLDKELPEDSVAIAALLHDVCKCDGYTINQDGNADYKPVSFPIGHGEKSVIMLLTWGFALTNEEMLAIRWHMGRAEIKSDRGSEGREYVEALKHPLCNLIVKADHNASR